MRIRAWTAVAALAAFVGVFAARSPAVAGGGKEPPPRPPADSAAVAAGEKLFMKNCQPCHGATGHGDGPASIALNPKPRNFTQPSQFKSKNDDEVFLVISKGGAARKLSAAMPAWGPKLKRDEIWDLIAFVRTFPARDSIARAKAAK